MEPYTALGNEDGKEMVSQRLTVIACVIAVLWAIPASATDTVTSATVSSSTVVDKTPPTASSPSIVVNNSDICQTGTSGALQTSLFGISGGTTTRDLNCERIKLARSVYGMGLKVAGVALLCQDARVWRAMDRAGTPCPIDGKIGDEAKELWLARPHLIPEGAFKHMVEKQQDDLVEPEEYGGD